MARSPTYSETVLGDQPRGYWRLSSASTIVDSGPNTLPAGTAFACTSNTGLLQGDSDTALFFNSSTSRAVIADNGVLNPTESMTIEAWVTPQFVVASRAIVSKPGQYELGLSGSSFRAILTHSGSGSTITFGPTLTAGSTYHVVFSIDGFKYFGCVNGGTYANRNTPVNPPPWDTGSSGFTIGNGSGFFAGVIDDVAVYNYALSEQQAMSHYIAGATATPGPPQTVVEVAFTANASEDYSQQVGDDEALGYWRLNESSGTSFANYKTVTIGTVVLPPLNAVGGVTLSQPSALTNDTTDKSVLLDGSTGYLSMPSNSAIDNVGAFGGKWALEAWVYPTAARTTQSCIITKEFTGGSIPFMLGYGNPSVDGMGGPNADSILFAGYYNGAWQLASDNTLTALPLNTWTHVAAEYSGSGVFLWKNGVLVAAPATSPAPSVPGGNRMFVGKRWDSTHGANDFFPGRIDEPAIYYSVFGGPPSSDRFSMHYGTRLNARPIVWTDISQYVRGYTVSGGRQHELDRYEAATLSVTVNNDQRQFEADYSGSPYYPNILPYRRIRVWEQKDGVRFPIFNGWIERWPQGWVSQSYHSEVEIQAVDGFDILNGAIVDATSFTSSSPFATDYWATFFMIYGANWDQQAYPILRKFLAGVSATQSTSTNSSVLSLVQDYETTENGEFYIDRYGRPTFLYRGARSVFGVPNLATFGDGPGEVPYRDIRPSMDRDTVLNIVAATREGGTEQTAKDWTSIATYGPRPFHVSTLNVDDAGALATANSILASHSTPARRFESIDLLYGDGGSNRLLVQLLCRQIGDRVNVWRRPDKTNPGSIMGETCLISHVQITRTPKLMAVSYQLIPAP